MRHICIALLALTACSDSRVDVADKIAKQATGSKVTIGGGKFVNVEISGSQAECDALQHWARENVKEPPDCVTVTCTLPDGSTDMIVAHDGIWEGGGGYYPQCAK
jgi:hypothetical protein